MSAQNLVPRLQVAAAHPQSHSHDELKKFAEDYAKACAEANARIIRAIYYLRRGFRGEAVRMCELEPNLIDEINCLNFRERPNWIAVAEGVGVSTPDVSFNLAVELNNAYKAYQHNRGQVAEFRKLNTLRQPLADRVSALHNLRMAEPQNPIWEDNLARLSSR